MNPIWRVTMEMSKSRSESQKQCKKRRDVQKDKTRLEKEKRRLEATERDRQRFIVGQEQSNEELEKYEDFQESPADKFQKELLWCVEQTKLLLASIKLSSTETRSQAEEVHRLLRVLTSGKAPMAKKRQVMRATFGDYRSKMQREEWKHKSEMNEKLRLKPANKTTQDNSKLYRLSSASVIETVPEVGRQEPVPESTNSDSSILQRQESLETAPAEKAMQELETYTKEMQIIHADNKMADDPFQITSEPEPPLIGVSLMPEAGQFSFNFDICEFDLDRAGTSRMPLANRNVDRDSNSESSTPEKGPGGGRKKPGSKRRIRTKKKLVWKDRVSSSVVEQNQMLGQLETGEDFKFDFPDPSDSIGSEENIAVL